MNKKSAASIKPVRNSSKNVTMPEFKPLEELFDTAKQGFLITIEANVDTSKRVDNLMSVRDVAYRFYGDRFDEIKLPKERIEYFKKLQAITTNTYEMILEAAMDFDLEEFKKKDMKDYFEHIIPETKDIKNEEDLLKSILIFQCVQPYGSKMSQLHQMVREEIEKREAYEKAED